MCKGTTWYFMVFCGSITSFLEVIDPKSFGLVLLRRKKQYLSNLDLHDFCRVLKFPVLFSLQNGGKKAREISKPCKNCAHPTHSDFKCLKAILSSLKILPINFKLEIPITKPHTLIDASESFLTI